MGPLGDALSGVPEIDRDAAVLWRYTNPAVADSTMRAFDCPTWRRGVFPRHGCGRCRARPHNQLGRARHGRLPCRSGSLALPRCDRPDIDRALVRPAIERVGWLRCRDDVLPQPGVPPGPSVRARRCRRGTTRPTGRHGGGAATSTVYRCLALQRMAERQPASVDRGLCSALLSHFVPRSCKHTVESEWLTAAAAAAGRHAGSPQPMPSSRGNVAIVEESGTHCRLSRVMRHGQIWKLERTGGNGEEPGMPRWLV